MTVGEGPIYSLLHQLVFGDDRSDDALSAAEEGQVEPVNKPKEDKELSGAEYYLKLLVCVVGLQASYLTWGVLQVLHGATCTVCGHACLGIGTRIVLPPPHRRE